MANDYGRGSGGYNNQRRPGGYYNSAGPVAALPQNYLKDGYFCQAIAADGEKQTVLRREYIIDFPKAIAAALEERDKNKSAQLRKFYDYCVAVCTRMDSGRTFKEVEGDLCRLLPFAKYAESRGRVSSVFVDFIERNVAQVKDEASFHAFLKHFEAVIAYIKK